MLRDWNMESGSMGRFYYQLAVGTIGPKVRMGGGGGEKMHKSQRSGYSKKKIFNGCLLHEYVRTFLFQSVFASISITIIKIISH